MPRLVLAIILAFGLAAGQCSDILEAADGWFIVRAEEKVDIVKGADGKTKIVPKEAPQKGLHGWIPICEKNLPYELTLSLLMTADQPGVPKPIKLQEQHRPFVPLDRPISEETGQALAAWAAGAGTPTMPVATRDQAIDLFKIANECGVPKERLKELLVEITGQASTSAIPANLYDSVVAAVQAEQVPA